MLQKKSFSREITRNLAHQSPRGNMHKLFDGIKTPLKRFLACLTFHRKEVRLRHLHKRTNPGSAPALLAIKRRNSAQKNIIYDHKIYSLLLELEKNKVQYSYFHFTRQLGLARQLRF